MDVTTPLGLSSPLTSTGLEPGVRGVLAPGMRSWLSQLRKRPQPVAVLLLRSKQAAAVEEALAALALELPRGVARPSLSPATQLPRRLFSDLS